MTDNPIIRREVRARWRRGPAFAMVFGYAVLLALIAGSSYLFGTDWTLDDDTLTNRMAEAGSNVFRSLLIMQALACTLLAPALTAAGLAGEREKGLLEALQLSLLSPRRIVGGKLAAALSFLLVLLLVPLPVMALCWLMGGVAPAQCLLALLFLVSTSVACALLGLCCSAWSRRANDALRATFGMVFVWLAGSLLAYLAAQEGWPRYDAADGTLAWWQLMGASLFACTNPVIGALAIGVGDDATLRFLNLSRAVVAGVGFGSQAALAWGAWWLAVRALRKPFSDEERVGGQSLAAPKAATVVAIERGPAAPRWEWLPARRFRADNPVLQREARGKWRSRRPSPVMLAGEILVAVGLAWCYLTVLMWALFDASSRDGVWLVVSNLGLTALLFATALMGAGAFTREHENGTWESIRLSLLTSSQIIHGKLHAALTTCFLCSLPFLLLVLPCIRRVGYQRTGNWLWQGSGMGISLTQAIGSLLVLAASAYCCNAWAMLVSWRCRRTSAAVGLTLGTVLLMLSGVPVLFASLCYPHTLEQQQFFLWHPFAALQAIHSPESHLVYRQGHETNFAFGGWGTAGVLWLAGRFFLHRLHLRLRHEMND